MGDEQFGYVFGYGIGFVVVDVVYVVNVFVIVFLCDVVEVEGVVWVVMQGGGYLGVEVGFVDVFGCY